MSFRLYKGGPVVRCEQLAAEYQAYCQYSQYSAPLGRCCSSCKQIGNLPHIMIQHFYQIDCAKCKLYFLNIFNNVFVESLHTKMCGWFIWH